MRNRLPLDQTTLHQLHVLGQHLMIIAQLLHSGHLCQTLRMGTHQHLQDFLLQGSGLLQIRPPGFADEDALPVFALAPARNLQLAGGDPLGE